MSFKKLQGQLAGKYGEEDAGKIAASIGRKKYGRKKFQRAATDGVKLRTSAASKAYSGLQSLRAIMEK